MLALGLDAKYMYQYLTLCARTAIVVSSRNKLFPQTSFRVCIFENSLLLDSRSSILASRRETQVSSFEDRVETVNLLLSGTVICIEP